MQNRRGVLPITTQISFRVDTLIEKSLRTHAANSGMEFSEYLRMVLTKHTYHMDVANEIKVEIKQIMEYSQTAFSEVYLLKQRITELEEKLYKETREYNK